MINLMIAFEALFLKGEKAGPSPGKKVAVACSVLLGKDDEERDKIRDSIAHAYKARNQIVNGSAYVPVLEDNIVVEDLSDIVSAIEDYLREAVKKLL